MEEKLVKLKRSRAAHRGIVTRHTKTIDDLFARDFDETVRSELKRFSVVLLKKQGDLRIKNEAIEELVEDEDLDAEVESSNAIDENLDLILCKLANAVAVKTSLTSPSTKSSARLPKLEIPTFSGDF